MTQFNNLKKQQAKIILELFEIARQHYLDAGGNPHRTPSGYKGDDYMTDEERQEALERRYRNPKNPVSAS